jgi:hypothetical protein
MSVRRLLAACNTPRCCGWLLALLLMAYAGLLVPAFPKASRTASAVKIFEPDAPAHVVPALMDLYRGRLVPGFSVYGHFPAYLAGALAAPVLVPLKMLHGAPSYIHFVLALRMAQLLMALLTVVFLFRLARLYLPPWLALTAALLLLTMHEFHFWTLNLHPDIFQAAMFAMAVFYIVRHQQSGRRRDFFLAAVLGGCAAAAKYYGFFLLPVVPLLLLSGKVEKFRVAPGAWRAMLRGSLLFGVIMVSVFLVFNLRILSVDEEVSKWLGIFGQLNAAPSHPGDLLGAKLANFASGALFGCTFLLVYVFAALGLLWSDLRLLRHGTFRLHPYQVLHLSLLVFALYYFVIFNDSYNVYHGERYPLAFMCLAPAAVLLLLQQLWVGRRWRPVAVALGVVLLITTALRVSGSRLDGFRPLPRAIDERLFTAILYGAIPADQQLLNAAYQVAPGADRARLRAGLSGEQRRRLDEYWRLRGILLHMPRPLWDLLVYPYFKETAAAFKVRGWVVAHVRPGSVILTETDFNLLPTTVESVSYSDNRDLPTQDIYCDKVDEENIAKFRPDYIFTAYAHVAEPLLARRDDYALADQLTTGGAVYILARHQRAVGAVRPAAFSDYTLLTRNAGQVDNFVRTADGLQVDGWAADFAAGLPAVDVLAVAEGRIVARVRVQGQRPDVAATLGQPGFARSGWNISVASRDLPPAGTRLRFFAMMGDLQHAAPLARPDAAQPQEFILGP